MGKKTQIKRTGRGHEEKEWVEDTKKRNNGKRTGGIKRRVKKTSGRKRWGKRTRGRKKEKKGSGRE